MKSTYELHFNNQLKAICSPAASIAKSVGHMFFTDHVEFYELDGEVFQAPLNNSFDTDGHRHGRWECSRARWDKSGNEARWIAEHKIA